MMRKLVSVVVIVSSLGITACASDQPGDVSGEGVGSGDGSGSDDGGGTGCIEGPCTQEQGSDDPSSPIDSACSGNQNVDAPELLVPKWTPLAPTVPAACLRGFEMNNLRHQVHTLYSASGSQAITLEVDIATYTAADAIRISAIDGSGNVTILIDTCRMRTAEYSDPTGGQVRPPEDSIRDFRVDLPAGTQELVIDNSNAESPTYVRILGLCDFDMQAPTFTHDNDSGFRVVTSR